MAGLGWPAWAARLAAAQSAAEGVHCARWRWQCEATEPHLTHNRDRPAKRDRSVFSKIRFDFVRKNTGSSLPSRSGNRALVLLAYTAIGTVVLGGLYWLQPVLI